MSTFFRAGGTEGPPGHWWRTVHAALETGADISALRLLHVAGPYTLDEQTSIDLEARLGDDAACMCYDPASLLIMDPGVSDAEIAYAVCETLDATQEQLRLWEAIELHPDGLSFQPLEFGEHIAGHTPSTAERRDIVLTDAEFSYVPLWGVREGEFFSYVCETVWNTGDGSRVPEEALQSFFANSMHALAIDRETLNKAIAQAQDFIDRYVFTKIQIPVHYSTLVTSKHRDAYLEICNRSIWPVIDDIFFEITRIPADIEIGELIEAIELLSPYGQGVMLRVDGGFTGFADLALTNVTSVGMDYHYDDRSESDIEATLQHFARQCQQVGLTCHAHNLRSMEMCVMAFHSGHAYMSSPLIAPTLELGGGDDEVIASPDMLRTLLHTKS